MRSRDGVSVVEGGGGGRLGRRGAGGDGGTYAFGWEDDRGWDRDAPDLGAEAGDGRAVHWWRHAGGGTPSGGTGAGRLPFV